LDSLGPAVTLRFGTDGVRGRANAELTPELVLALGRAAAKIFGSQTFLVGRDTRISGTLIASALAAGLTAEGVDVIDLGVLPTPGVAWFSASEKHPAAVVSASHNPFPDNGVKFFASGGRKLSDQMEARLEGELDALLGGSPRSSPVPTGAEVGQITARGDVEPYLGALVASAEGRGFEGMAVVLDCANGAASQVAPEVFRRLGAQVEVIHAQPDGRNINDGCGSTYPDHLRAAVVEHGAHAGLAFDGDADRVLAIDARGQLVDGDQLMALLAVDRHGRDALPGATVVVTVMANLGLREAMRAHGISVAETKVGDRYVLEALEKGGWVLGGEQSGHIILRDLATTGDGILTGVQVLDAMARSGRSLAELASVMTRRPQVLRSVQVARRALDEADELWSEVRAVEARLDGKGRVLIRPSGTEAVVRVMVEAPTTEEAEEACEALSEAVVKSLGPGAG
jgi:phosphoglucosamine mutase